MEQHDHRLRTSRKMPPTRLTTLMWICSSAGRWIEQPIECQRTKTESRRCEELAPAQRAGVKVGAMRERRPLDSHGRSVYIQNLIRTKQHVAQMAECLLGWCARVVLLLLLRSGRFRRLSRASCFGCVPPGLALDKSKRKASFVGTRWSRQRELKRQVDCAPTSGPAPRATRSAKCIDCS